MIITDYPEKAIRLLQITGLSKFIFPELDKLIRLKQNKYHDFDVMKHTLLVLNKTPKDLVTRLAALFHDIGKYKTKETINGEIHFYKHEELGAEIAKDILKHLKYSKEIIDSVYILIQNHMRTKSYGDSVDVKDKVLRKLQYDLDGHLEQTLDLIHADNSSHGRDHLLINQVPLIRERLKNLKGFQISQHVKLPINGNDIMRHLGLSPGPKIKELLLAVEDAWLENPEIDKDRCFEIIEKVYYENV
jgi:putative nucleotidyltransferase with HDIG domain